MRITIRSIILLSVAWLGLGVTGPTSADDKGKTGEVKVGDPAPAFQATDDQGNTWKALSSSPGALETRAVYHQLIAVDPKNDMHVFVNDSYSL